jgi:hypothetical protein
VSVPAESRARRWLLPKGYSRHPGDVVRLVLGILILLLTTSAIPAHEVEHEALMAILARAAGVRAPEVPLMTSFRSRGTANSTGPTSVNNRFGVLPLRELPDPRPDRSCLS